VLMDKLRGTENTSIAWDRVNIDYLPVPQPPQGWYVFDGYAA